MTTHDWASSVDVDHISSVHDDVRTYALGGVLHLVLEVLQYALDEAADGTATSIDVRVHADGSVEVTDDGRGTDTRRDKCGTVVIKPIMATADLRFHGVVDVPNLPDGLPRRGISVVAALCSRVDHTNVRAHGGWIVRYERGLPVADPLRVSGRGAPTGTAVRLWPDPEVFGAAIADVDRLRRMADAIETTASITVRER